VKIITSILILSTALFSYSFNDITKFAEKASNIYNKKEKNTINQRKDNTQYDEFIVNDEVPYNIEGVKRNNTILKKKIFQSLECNRIYKNSIIDSCYSLINKGAIAVAYVLDGDTTNFLSNTSYVKWNNNKRIPKRYKSNLDDYIGTGFVKAALAPREYFSFSKKTLKDSSDLNLNAIPMNPKLYKKEWLTIQKYAHNVSTKLNPLYVVDYIVYSHHKIGENKISIPSSIYKIIYNKKENFMECFYFDNTKNRNFYNNPILNNRVSCQDVF